MSGLVTVLIMSALLGVASFAIGFLPLSFTFSKPTLAMLTTFGTGLLLGAALGVIIPEGVETVVRAEAPFFPKKTIAMSLLMGFKFMLLIDRIIHRNDSHSHSSTHTILPTSDPDPSATHARTSSAGANGQVVFDVELGELEQAEGLAREGRESQSNSEPPRYETSDSESKRKAYPLTLGLVVHALADGLALGSSALAGNASSRPGLSLVIFVALIVHKAPTALALSTSLLSTSLSRLDCQKHLAVFSAATPLSTLLSYAVMSALGMANDQSWTGSALLFSGGTFLFVATVLQPGKSASDELGNRLRFVLIILGMLVPVTLSSLVGDVH
ncbi:Zinc/iron permease [Cristinia sonorae]|uniref:Zinc/iron permease n=1 Tax=Cristinia sonorae TaxID=1940300 RepID=A0A8K0UFD7_9AGAR|nr:Zinc/iron permease [Cristinia sonorae]